MQIIDAGYEILTPISNGGKEELQRIELAARTCYKSESKITEDGKSARAIVANIIRAGHEAMIEHSQLTVKFICDRAIANEIARHRLCSFAQESTRYCNYSSDKFNSEITVVKPLYLDTNSQRTLAYEVWKAACLSAERSYFDLLEFGLMPEEARAVLPNSLKTEIVVTANYREWRNILKLRTDSHAHPQIRQLMIPLMMELKCRIPVVFDDIPIPSDAKVFSRKGEEI